MSEQIARGHIVRDPRPVTDLAASFIASREGEQHETFALTDEEAQLAAYVGYPEVIADIEEHLSEAVPTVVVDAAQEAMPLHKHPDGRLKKIYEAENAEELKAIIDATNIVVVAGLGRSAIGN